MTTEGNLGRRVLAVVGVSILGLLLVAGATQYLGAGGVATVPDRANVTTVQPVANGSDLWPYTGRREGFGSRTLAVNVIAVGSGEHVRQEFRRQVQANWTTRAYQDPPDNAATGNGSAVREDAEPVLEIVDQEIVWLPAHGATRYTYVLSQNGAEQWLRESYQLYDGTYLGARHHVRAYDSPYDPWTAMQGHREYWDWFRLRHTVTSIADTQRYVDAQFLADERVERVYKVHLRNGDSKDGNGWATVIEFAALTSLLVGVGRVGRIGGLAARARRWLSTDRPGALARTGTLFVAVGGLYLGVRVGGVAMEQQFRSVSPKVIAGGLYPVLALGLPVAAYLLSRRQRPEDAFVAAVTGVVAAFLVEYGYLGLEVIPVPLLLHRVALLLALGLVAAAGALSARDTPGWTRLLALGVAGWVVSLGLPLFGLV